VAVVISLSAATVLAGCSLFGGTDVFTLAVGDCMESTDLETTLETVPVIECGEPHESEVYASFQLDDGTFPGTEAITTEAEGLCLGAFEEFAGLPFNDSELLATTLTPTEDSWDRQEDREVLCIIIDPDGDVTGTMRDANR
jgi:hypothetical protein